MGMGASVGRLGSGCTETPRVATKNPENSMYLNRQDHATLVEKMKWASTFITILPLPVCLIDIKGFIHHTNDMFNEIITIEFDDNTCPFAGRFFEDVREMRTKIEQIAAAEEIIVLGLQVPWKAENIRSVDANQKYEWTISGSKRSDGVVITAREINAQKKSVVSTTMKSFAETDAEEQKMKIEKYKEILAKRIANAEAKSQSMGAAEILELQAKSKWGRFYQRVDVVDQDQESTHEMSSFVDVLKKVVSTNEVTDESDRAILDAAVEAGLASCSPRSIAQKVAAEPLTTPPKSVGNVA